MTIPAGMRFSGTVTPVAPTPGADVAMYILPNLAACVASPTSCTAGLDATSSGAETLRYVNPGATTTVFFVVDTFSTSAPAMTYDLNIVIDAVPAGDTCATATALTAGTALTMETTANYTNNYSGAGTNCASSSAGPDRAYSISVPNGQRLTVTVTPVAAFDTSISIVAGAASACEALPRVCAANANNGSSGAADVATYVNLSGAAQTVYAIVDSSSGTGNTFSILAALDTPPSVGDTCQAPDALTAGTVLTSQTTVGYSNNYSGGGTACSSSSAGPDRVYSLSIPASQRATITVTPNAGFDSSISVAGSPATNCDTRTCLANDNTGGTGVADVLNVSNKTAQPQTVYVIVDSTAAAGGLFSVGAVLGAIPVGEFCANAAAAITATTTLSGETTVGYANDYGSGTNCSGTSGADHAYAITVPNGQRLVATVTPVSAWDPSISLVAGPATACETTPRVCLSGDDSGGATTVNSVTYNNTSGASQTVFAVIDTSVSATTGTYDLGVTIAPIPAAPPGDVCGGAVVVAATSTLTMQTTVGFNNDYVPATSCTNYTNAGNDKVYAVTLAAGKSVTAAVAPVGSGDPSIYLVMGPAASCTATPVCIIGDDSGAAAATNTVMYTNSTAGTVTIYIVVDSLSTTPLADYTLTVTLP